MPYLVSQNNPRGPWSSYGPLPVPAGVHIVAVTATSGNQNNLQAVCIGQDGVPYTVWQDNNTGNWAPGANLPVPAGAHIIAAATAPANLGYGILQVICLAQDGHAYQVWQDHTGLWTAAGTVLFIPSGVNIVAVATTDFSYGGEVICLGQDGAPYTAWQDPNTEIWTVQPVPSIPLHATGLVAAVSKNLQVIFLE
jgi:hypothetical protein